MAGLPLFVVVAAGTVGEPHVAAAIGDYLRVLHRRARHHYPSARLDVEPLGTRVRVVAEWPCRDDHALVVVAQVIDHEGRDSFVPLAVDAVSRSEAFPPLALHYLPLPAVLLFRLLLPCLLPLCFPPSLLSTSFLLSYPHFSPLYFILFFSSSFPSSSFF